MTKRPGRDNKPFYIQFAVEPIFKKNEMIIAGSKAATVKVLKVYRKTWWRRFRIWLGLPTRMFQCKVVQI